MEQNQEAFNQIAETLAGHFDCLYYVDMETNHYFEYSSKGIYQKLDLPKEGEDFFVESQENCKKCIHPEDVDRVIRLVDKDTVIKHLSKENSYTEVYRLVVDGRVVRVRHIELLCDEGRHLICCLENIEEEMRAQEEQAKTLQSARRMARRDELTGVRNKNAYQEFAESIENKIKAGMEDYHVGVVVCDVNDLKVLNDTRGHSFGDEAIQRTSRMICAVFEHSPVFRIGGDEFIVVLSGDDYENRDFLLKKLRAESALNGRSGSGPVVASGLAVYEPGSDESFAQVFGRGDREMYQNKQDIKAERERDPFRELKIEESEIPPDRKRKLDTLFGALYTVAGGGYVFLNDLRYDFSRWSLPLVDDFGMPSEYMVDAGKLWEVHVHPEDIADYREVVNAVFETGTVVRNLHYRVFNRDGEYVECYNRAFILRDADGQPEYFGGIMVRNY